MTKKRSIADVVLCAVLILKVGTYRVQHSKSHPRLFFTPQKDVISINAPKNPKIAYPITYKKTSATYKKGQKTISMPLSFVLVGLFCRLVYDQ